MLASVDGILSIERGYVREFEFSFRWSRADSNRRRPLPAGHARTLQLCFTLGAVAVAAASDPAAGDAKAANQPT